MPHCQAIQCAQDRMPTPCQPPRTSNSRTSRSQLAVAAASRTDPVVIAAASSPSGVSSPSPSVEHMTER
jgi:hypothetical protein